MLATVTGDGVEVVAPVSFSAVGGVDVAEGKDEEDGTEEEARLSLSDVVVLLD